MNFLFLSIFPSFKIWIPVFWSVFPFKIIFKIEKWIVFWEKKNMKLEIFKQVVNEEFDIGYDFYLQFLFRQI